MTPTLLSFFLGICVSLCFCSLTTYISSSDRARLSKLFESSLQTGLSAKDIKIIQSSLQGLILIKAPLSLPSSTNAEALCTLIKSTLNGVRLTDADSALETLYLSTTAAGLLGDKCTVTISTESTTFLEQVKSKPGSLEKLYYAGRLIMPI